MLQVGWKYFPFTEISLKLSSFSDELCGIRIVQLSDLHITKRTPLDYLNTLVTKINDLKVDLVVFTGDIIQTPASNIKKQLASFSKLNIPAYYVTGNHDMIYGANTLRQELDKYNIICLDNKIEIIKINETSLQLVGLSDRYSFIRFIKRDIKKLFSSLDSQLPTILLAHQPKDILYTKDYRIDLQLSGHTHGGQIYPFNLIIKIFQPYFAGLYTHENTKLFVSRGLGYWGVDFRYKSPSEIPIFTIN